MIDYKLIIEKIDFKLFYYLWLLYQDHYIISPCLLRTSVLSVKRLVMSQVNVISVVCHVLHLTESSIPKLHAQILRLLAPKTHAPPKKLLLPFVAFAVNQITQKTNVISAVCLVLRTMSFTPRPLNVRD